MTPLTTVLPPARADLPLLVGWFDHPVSAGAHLRTFNNFAPPQLAVAKGMCAQFAGDTAGSRARYAAIWSRLSLTPGPGEPTTELPEIDESCPWILIGFTQADGAVCGALASELLLPQQAFILAEMCSVMVSRDLLPLPEGQRVVGARTVPRLAR